jgi:hypothetical protein
MFPFQAAAASEKARLAREAVKQAEAQANANIAAIDVRARVLADLSDAFTRVVWRLFGVCCCRGGVLSQA